LQHGKFPAMKHIWAPQHLEWVPEKVPAVTPPPSKELYLLPHHKILHRLNHPSMTSPHPPHLSEEHPVEIVVVEEGVELGGGEGPVPEEAVAWRSHNFVVICIL